MKLSIFILLLLPVSAGVWATEITLQNGNWKLPANGAVTEILTIQSEQDVRLSLAEAVIPVASFQGGFAELCGEYRTNRLRKSGRHPHGGKINLQWRTPDGKRHYAPHSLPEGDCDWTAFRLVGAIPTMRSICGFRPVCSRGAARSRSAMSGFAASVRRSLSRMPPTWSGRMRLPVTAEAAGRMPVGKTMVVSCGGWCRADISSTDTRSR